MKNYRKPNTIDFYIKDISRMLRYGLDEHLKAHGITGPQGRLLGLIYGANAGGIQINRKYLQKKTGVSGPSITSLLDSLEQKGYIIRIASKEDARSLNITITEKGEKLLNETHGVFREAESKLTQGMSNEEKKQFKNLLKRAHSNFEG